MKRALLLAAFLAGLPCLSTSFGGQDGSATADDAAEERYRSMNADVKGLEETMGLVRKRIAKLDEEVRALRDEITRLSSRNNDTATRESLERLAKSVEEVDRKRQADNEKVLAALTALQKYVEKMGAAPERSRPPASSNPGGPRGNGTGGGATPQPPDNPKVELKGYAVKPNDTLSGIVSKLRSAKINVTQKQIEDANPGVRWKDIKPGQQIIIPVPIQQP